MLRLHAVGENGHKVSQYFKSALPAAIFLDHSFPLDIHSAILRQTRIVETMLVADRDINTEFSGSTMSLCIILNGKLFATNIGNSRCIIGQGKSHGKIRAVQLTQDHIPENEIEKHRIKSKGGRIFAVNYDDFTCGKSKIWLGHMDVPGLTISRSLGDTVATTVGVISLPECSTYNLNLDTKYLVVATDGIWEMMQNQEIIDVLCSTNSVSKALNIICAESYSRWMDKEQVVDDITMFVFRF